MNASEMKRPRSTAFYVCLGVLLGTVPVCADAPPIPTVEAQISQQPIAGEPLEILSQHKPPRVEGGEYAIVAGNDAGIFTIDPPTGAITVRNPKPWQANPTRATLQVEVFPQAPKEPDAKWRFLLAAGLSEKEASRRLGRVTRFQVAISAKPNPLQSKTVPAYDWRIRDRLNNLGRMAVALGDNVLAFGQARGDDVLATTRQWGVRLYRAGNELKRHLEASAAKIPSTAKQPAEAVAENTPLAPVSSSVTPAQSGLETENPPATTSERKQLVGRSLLAVLAGILVGGCLLLRRRRHEQEVADWESEIRADQEFEDCQAAPVEAIEAGTDSPAEIHSPMDDIFLPEDFNEEDSFELSPARDLSEEPPITTEPIAGPERKQNSSENTPRGSAADFAVPTTPGSAESQESADFPREEKRLAASSSSREDMELYEDIFADDHPAQEPDLEKIAATLCEDDPDEVEEEPEEFEIQEPAVAENLTDEAANSTADPSQEELDTLLGLLDQKYGLARESTKSDEPAPAPVLPVETNPPPVTSRPGDAESELNDSIAAYMENLLNRNSKRVLAEPPPEKTTSKPAAAPPPQSKTVPVPEKAPPRERPEIDVESTREQLESFRSASNTATAHAIRRASKRRYKRRLSNLLIFGIVALVVAGVVLFFATGQSISL